LKLEDLITKLKSDRYFGTVHIEFRAGMPFSVIQEQSIDLEQFEDSRQSILKTARRGVIDPTKES